MDHRRTSSYFSSNCSLSHSYSRTLVVAFALRMSSWSLDAATTTGIARDLRNLESFALTLGRTRLIFSRERWAGVFLDSRMLRTGFHLVLFKPRINDALTNHVASCGRLSARHL